MTVTVSLTRKDMKHLFGDNTVKEQTIIDDAKSGAAGEGSEEVVEEENQTVKKPAWVRQRKGPKKSNKKGSNKKAPAPKAAPAQTQATATSTQQNNTPNARRKDEAKVEKDPSKDGGSDVSDTELESERSDEEESSHDKKDSAVDDDDTEWERFQQRISKREKILEGRSKLSHEVHCPLFPEAKQEYWWAYICDRKSHTLLTAPAHITSLASFEEVQLRFTAPRWPGLYTFTVCLRSDSYIGFDQAQDIKVRFIFSFAFKLVDTFLCNCIIIIIFYSWTLKRPQKFRQSIRSGIYPTRKRQRTLILLMNIPNLPPMRTSVTMNKKKNPIIFIITLVKLR